MYGFAGKPTPAVIIDAVSVSYRAIVITVQPGYDGGAAQTISCQYKLADSDDGYVTADVRTLPLTDVASFEMTVTKDLQPGTRYVLRLESDNSNDGSATHSEVVTVTTRGKH